MPDAKTITAAVSLAVAGAAVGFAARGTGAPAPTVASALPPSTPPPPPPCKQACDTLATMCDEGKATNCVDFLSRMQSTDGGGWSCADPLTAEALKGLGLERCAK